MSICLGLDSSTQSLSALVLDTKSGQVILEKSANFGEDLPQFECPNGFLPDGPDGQIHAPPMMWLEALDLLFQSLKNDGFDLGQIEAISGSGQQHGSVYLNDRFASQLKELSATEPLAKQFLGSFSRPTSPIWMDNTTSAECQEIEAAVGGPLEVCRRSGSIAIERFTGPQIRAFSKRDPAAYDSTIQIHLVSSFLASVLAGCSAPIDFGDGAGMNLMNLVEGKWDSQLLGATVSDLHEKLPELAPSNHVVGPISPYFVEKYGFSADCQCVAWSGDNPCSLIGMGAASPGKVVISLGTSDTLFAAMSQPRTDPNGFGHVFGNPWGGFMSLVCFRNGSLAREALKEELGVDWSAFEQAAAVEFLTDEVLLPFAEAEITPRISGTGFRCTANSELSPTHRIRLLLEGQFLNMKLQARWMELQTQEIYVTGGASANQGVCQIMANVFGLPVKRLSTSSSACLGAALRAAEASCQVDQGRLEELFCHVDLANVIEPDMSLQASYTAKLDRFEEFLGSFTESTT